MSTAKKTPWFGPLEKKAAVALLAIAGTIFTMGAVFKDYRDLPVQVSTNTHAIEANRDAIERSNGKLDSVLCLLVQDQLVPPGEPLNPLLCLSPSVDPSSFLPLSPGN